jgi:hypothetical protein
VVFIVFPPVLLLDDKLNETPRALDGIDVGPGVRIHEVDAVVHSDGHCLVTE